MKICVEGHLKIEDKEVMKEFKRGRYSQGKRRNRTRK